MNYYGNLSLFYYYAKKFNTLNTFQAYNFFFYDCKIRLSNNFNKRIQFRFAREEVVQVDIYYIYVYIECVELFYCQQQKEEVLRCY